VILLLVSFVAGLLTVLAPCILPLLPIIVGGSVGGERNMRRALTVTVSLAVSVILFTLLIKVSTLLIGIPAESWKWFSGGIIIAFGVVSLIPSLWERVPFLTTVSIRSNQILASGYKRQNVWGDVIVGASLGPIFSTCSPTYFLILAAVLPQNFVLGVIYLIAYSAGLSLSLLFVAFVGQKILNKTGVVANPRGLFKKILGIIFILVGIAIITGADKTLQGTILDAGFFDVTKIEQKLLEFVPANDTQQISTTTLDTKEVMEENDVIRKETFEPMVVESKTITERETPTAVPMIGTTTEEVKKVPMAPVPDRNNSFVLAPEIVNPSGFINTDGKPITLSEFTGKKVVLVSFWTYSCINCKRTLPYLNSWYEKYKDQGLEIVSIHTPEFAYERVLKNVEAQVFNTYDIKYPVVLDNDYSTWKAFGNRYWPRKYLIDIDGYIVYDHIGEGAYDETEDEIVEALKKRAERLGE
jgi:cytochrome c biogenesis protein CcdA/thiol-disulfide isomerase/thioredoxin